MGASLAPAFEYRDRKSRVVQGVDMFGSILEVACLGIYTAGRPHLPIRLMMALLHLKYACTDCDESLVERWAQHLYF
jgi:IS5 family transposase